MSSRNNSHLAGNGGFTLVEVMFSILILMVVMLGAFQSVYLAMDKNLENTLRQKSIVIAEQQMNDLKALPFENITGAHTITKMVRLGSSAMNKEFLVQRRINTLSTSTNTKQISLRISWLYRGRQYEHQVASSIGNNN